jgi:hypothetical protein
LTRNHNRNPAPWTSTRIRHPSHIFLFIPSSSILHTYRLNFPAIHLSTTFSTTLLDLYLNATYTMNVPSRNPSTSPPLRSGAPSSRPSTSTDTGPGSANLPVSPSSTRSPIPRSPSAIQFQPSAAYVSRMNGHGGPLPQGARRSLNGTIRVPPVLPELTYPHRQTSPALPSPDSLESLRPERTISNLPVSRTVAAVVAMRREIVNDFGPGPAFSPAVSTSSLSSASVSIPEIRRLRHERRRIPPMRRRPVVQPPQRDLTLTRTRTIRRVSKSSDLAALARRGREDVYSEESDASSGGPYFSDIEDDLLRVYPNLKIKSDH